VRGPARILFHGDRAHPAARRLLGALDVAGWEVRIVVRALEADSLLRSEEVGGLLLDPDLDDPEFLRRARRDHPERALIAWLPTPSSTRAADLLEAGADEVVHGGMTERELVARLARIVRRDDRPGGPLRLGALTIDPAEGQVTWAEVRLPLTRREREVLGALAESAGRTVPRERLYRQVWGYTMARGDRSVDVNVKRLRDKLAAVPGMAVEIKTQAGVGYRLETIRSAEGELGAPPAASGAPR
jgi:DNA-binding response OmpR family regulator